jgi:hypothetical protein
VLFGIFLKKQFFIFACITRLQASIFHSSPEKMDAPTSEQREVFPLFTSDSRWRAPERGARVYIIGDFFYWAANRDALNAGYKAQGIPGVLPLKGVKIKPFSIEWNPGFRVGLGYRLPHDLWEARGYFTQLRTTNHLHQTASSGSFIDPNLGQLPTVEGFVKEEASWHLKYKLLDVELMRQCSVSKALSFSPFLGARGAWLHQNLHEKFYGSNFLDVKTESHFRGGGLRLGSDLNFYFMPYVSLFGQIAASLLSGEFEEKTRLELDDDPLLSASGHPSRCCASCEARAGAKGTVPLYRREAFLTFGLTYDMTFWFFQDQLLSFGPDAVQFPAHMANLTLQGITLTTRLDF